MYPKLFFLLLCGVFSGCLHAQILDDTLAIGSVVVKGAKSEYAAGAKIQTLDKNKIQAVNSGDLSTAIKRYTPVYVRSFAGGLSTISFRGTSADHTAIMYDGINLNSLTLGHSNMCDIPMFLFDEIDIQYGGASSLYGSDAIGGSIHLKSIPAWEKGITTFLQQDVASFGTYFTGAKFRACNGQIESATKVYYQESKNEFPFENTSVLPFQEKSDTQINASYQNHGILQEVFYKITSSNYVALKGIHTYNWREVQPNMSATRNGGTMAEIFNRNTRIIGKYVHSFSDNQRLDVSMNYVNDFQLYQNEDTIATRRFTGNLEFERAMPYNGKINLGTKHTYIVPDVYAYSYGIDEHRTELYASYAQPLFKTTKVTLNFRQSVVSDYTPEFAPSIGLKHIIRRNINNFIKITSSFSRSYKIPTFNDRFWVSSGNPDLKAEKGWNAEGGLQIYLNNAAPAIDIQVNGYYSIIDDWIEWRPSNGSIWRPQNYKQVHSRGLEVISKVNQKILDLSTEYGFSYSFNQSTPEKVYKSQKEKIREQLPYSPEHTGLLYLDVKPENWLINTNVSYTGKRNTGSQDALGNSIQLSGYILLDASVGYKLIINQAELTLMAQINNIFNTDYVNIADHAMPGRSYHFTIQIQL
ncbi:MAG: TonB-dependent receptor [Bacteroidetes bacterium]|jgi:iron complex outermembrane receptor protein|nr:TonB-dependent receptor [Bacteroidota bacterium]